MKEGDLSAIFSSQARFRVLRTLFTFDGLLPLRHIEALTQLAIGSVQLATKTLQQEKVLVRAKKGRYVFYGVDKRHPFFSLIRKLFFCIDQENVKQRASEYKQRAQASLKFSEELIDLLKKNKNDSH